MGAQIARLLPTKLLASESASPLAWRDRTLRQGPARLALKRSREGRISRRGGMVGRAHGDAGGLSDFARTRQQAHRTIVSVSTRSLPDETTENENSDKARAVLTRLDAQCRKFAPERCGRFRRAWTKMISRDDELAPGPP